MEKTAPPHSTKPMTSADFRRLSEFIYDNYGIKLPPAKKGMLESRLQKRIRLLGMRSFSEYCEFVFSPEGIDQELIQMIDVVTTNKTDFFREPTHFDYLSRTVLPEVTNSQKFGQKRNIRVWSAGCSTGEEPYTLAMVLSEYMEQNPGLFFSIIASDLSTQVLAKAMKAIYDMEKVEPIPLALKKKYLLKSKDKNKNIIRIVRDLREIIEFRRINLMDEDFGIKDKMDIIFCRNVIIYFDRQTQERLFYKFYRQLSLGGYLFIGHSETLTGMDVPFVPTIPTVYRKLK